jgi:hypothetical protein
MRVLFIPCGKKPEVREIDGSLASMQELVGGLIEDVCWGDEKIALICNDEGLLLGLPPNRSIRWKHIDNYTIIHGDFFLCGVDGENYTSLPPKLIEFYAERFRYPEIFLPDGEGGILSLTLRFSIEKGCE